jgi:hypothetical protein
MKDGRIIRKRNVTTNFFVKTLANVILETMNACVERTVHISIQKCETHEQNLHDTPFCCSTLDVSTAYSGRN